MRENLGAQALVFIGLSLLLGCNQDKREVVEVTAEDPSASATVPVPARKPPLWYEGKWKGKEQSFILPSAAELDNEERKKAQKKRQTAPSSTDQQEEAKPLEASQVGLRLEVELSIAKEGTVSGSGRLGTDELTVSGILDGETLRAKLIAPLVRGTLIATKEGDEMKGRVNVSVTTNKKNVTALVTHESPLTLRLHR